MNFSWPSFKILKVIIVGAGLGLFLPAQARVATAPTSADQRLINPAVAPLRESLGFAVDASHQDEQEKVLGLKEGSSLGIKTKIDIMNTNSVFRSGNYFFELSISPQKGTKDTASVASNTAGGNHSNTSSNLTLIPVQASASTRLGPNFSFGFKVMYTHFGFDDATDLEVNTDSYNQLIDESKKVSGSILVAAPGFIYQLGSSGFSLAYVAEFLRLQNEQSVVGTTTLLSVTTSGVTETTVNNINSSDTILARKDIVGIGFAQKFAGGNNFRVDLSYEKMPPLTKVQGYPFGEMARFIAEANWIFFRLGVEATRKTGYYVDPYNMIPYFFKIDHLGTDPVMEYGFFGGLKTSKGHGFGASFSQSTSQVQEKLSVGSTAQDVEKKFTRFGLSYSYFF